MSWKNDLLFACTDRHKHASPFTQFTLYIGQPKLTAKRQKTTISLLLFSSKFIIDSLNYIHLFYMIQL